MAAYVEHAIETERAKNPSPFLSVIDHVFSKIFSPDKEFSQQYSEVESLFNVAKEHCPGDLIFRLLKHLNESKSETLIRRRCARLLRLILSPTDTLCATLSPALKLELKNTLCICICEETSLVIHEILMNIFYDVCEVLLPLGQWQEILDFMFLSISNGYTKKLHCAVLLFAELIPRCRDVFLFRVNYLSKAFKKVMDMGKEGHEFSGAVAHSMMALIVNLTTPDSQGKFSDLVPYIMKALSEAVEAMDDIVIGKILEDMILLGRMRSGILSKHFDYVIEKVLEIVQDLNYVTDTTKTFALEFLITMAEDRKCGCGMIQNVSLKRLFTILMASLTNIEDDPTWGEADLDGKIGGELGNCVYAMESFSRLAVALRGKVVVPILEDILHKITDDLNWRSRHAASTTLGLIACGCSEDLRSSGVLLTIIQKLLTDKHPRVIWATIQAVGLVSGTLGPHFHEKFYGTFLPPLVSVMEDHFNPRLQVAATSTVGLISKNCSADVIYPFLKNIWRNLRILQQSEKTALNKAALTSLASLANSFPEDFPEQYDHIVRYLKLNLATPPEESDLMLVAKILECSTIIGLSVGKKRCMADVEKVVEELTCLQEHHCRNDDPIRSYLFQAWSWLCKCLGTEFVPYLDVSMPPLLQSALLDNFLSHSENSVETLQNSEEKNEMSATDDEVVDITVGKSKIRFISNILEEKATACNVLCSFAEELAGEFHCWLYETLQMFLPLLTFEFDVTVQTAAISAMPLLLHSAVSAKSLQGFMQNPVKQSSSGIIMPALLDALHKESKIKIQVRLLEALNRCIQISSSCLDENHINQFINGIKEKLLVTHTRMIERKRRVQEGTDLREKELLEEETEQDDSVYKAIGDCLRTCIKTLKAAFLPCFDKLLSFLEPLCDKDSSTEQRMIVLRIYCDVAEQCREDAFTRYEERLLKLLKECDLDNPDTWQMVAHGISISSEFGGEVFKRNRLFALSTLNDILYHPKAEHADYVMGYETSVVAFGKMCQFGYEGIDSHKLFTIWLGHLPLRNNLAEAKLAHEDLCSMIEKSENLFIGFNCENLEKVTNVFTEVLWARNNLATEDTSYRMKNLIKHFQLTALCIESFGSSLPTAQNTNECFLFF